MTAPTEAQNRKDIWSAARTAKLRLVGELLESGMDVDQRDSDGNTPLIMAAMAGKTEVARLLIERGADVDAKSNSGSAAIHSAAFLGHQGVVKLLVENDADTNLLNGNDQTPLEVASLSWNRVRRYAERLNSSLRLGIDLDEAEANRQMVADYMKASQDESDR